MLKVYKKNGQVVNFILEKIHVSIEGAADTIGFPINEGEVSLITKDVERKILKLRGQDGITSVYEIRAIITRTLRDMGYDQVADAYYRYQ